MAGRSDPELAAEIGARVVEACTMAGIAGPKDLSQRTGFDERTCRRYLRAEIQVGLRNVMRLAEALEVSIDWLVLGRNDPPDGLLAWLESPEGRTAPEEARRYARDLPLKGYRASPEFYELAMQRWVPGIPPEMPETVVRETRKTLRSYGDAIRRVRGTG